MCYFIFKVLLFSTPIFCDFLNYNESNKIFNEIKLNENYTDNIKTDMDSYKFDVEITTEAIDLEYNTEYYDEDNFKSILELSTEEFAYVVDQQPLSQLQTLFNVNFNNNVKNSNPVPPQFMTDLFNSVTENNGKLKSDIPHNAKIVKGFIESKTPSVGYFYFNITETNPEWILEAELHLYRIPSEVKDLHPSVFMSPYYLISVYQVEDINMLNNPDVHRLLNVHYVGALSSGWQVFNVKQAVLSWLSGKSKNLGLLVTASTMAGETLPPPGVRYIRQGHRNKAQQPLLVLFENDKLIKESEDNTAFSNSTENDSSESAEDKKLLNIKIKRSINQQKINSGCKLENVNIHFSEIGWDRYIISPEIFPFMQCRGNCNFPLNEIHNPSNHAIAQSIAKMLQRNVENPCCVSTKLTYFCLLYYDDKFNVIFKIYDDMIAEECGCR